MAINNRRQKPTTIINNFNNTPANVTSEAPKEPKENKYKDLNLCKEAIMRGDLNQYRFFPPEHKVETASGLIQAIKIARDACLANESLSNKEFIFKDGSKNENFRRYLSGAKYVFNFIPAECFTKEFAKEAFDAGVPSLKILNKAENLKSNIDFAKYALENPNNSVNFVQAKESVYMGLDSKLRNNEEIIHLAISKKGSILDTNFKDYKTGKDLSNVVPRAFIMKLTDQQYLDLQRKAMHNNGQDNLGLKAIKRIRQERPGLLEQDSPEMIKFVKEAISCCKIAPNEVVNIETNELTDKGINAVLNGGAYNRAQGIIERLSTDIKNKYINDFENGAREVQMQSLNALEKSGVDVGTKMQELQKEAEAKVADAQRKAEAAKMFAGKSKPSQPGM